jgi:putative transposase
MVTFTSHLYKTECVHHDGPFRTVDKLELATCHWVDWFNNSRLHSSIGYITPAAFEQEYYRHHERRQLPLSA